jgi:hypothetical protein
MNGSTRACVTILNVFGLFSLLVGVIATVLTVVNSAELSLGTLFETIPGLASILSGALLIGASEGLRLLSEIRDKLTPTTPAAQRVRRAA